MLEDEKYQMGNLLPFSCCSIPNFQLTKGIFLFNALCYLNYNISNYPKSLL